MKKIHLLYAFLFLVLFFYTCAQQQVLTPGSDNPNKPGSATSAVYRRLINGSASAADLMAVVKNHQSAVADADSQGVVTLSETGRLFVTLRDNNAGWRSQLYMTAAGENILLFDDTRQGPLNLTSEYAYRAGTSVGFFLLTYAPNGTVFSNNAASSLCRVEYAEPDAKWIIAFEDNPSGDMDFNDAVVEVTMAADSYADLSAKIEVSVDYLDHHGYNAEGYVIYYIGEPMRYKVNISVLEDDPAWAGSPFTVYAVQEYFQDITCDRWWYTPPPGESRVISVLKGDPLPDQDPIQKWSPVTLALGAPVSLEGTHTAGYATAAGNDQTHVIIVRENESGQIELTVFDNPETGIYDPPAP